MQKLKTQTVKSIRYDWSSLNNRYITIWNNKWQIYETTNDKYENFVNVYVEAAAECITTKLKAKSTVLWETQAGRKKTRWYEKSIFMQ